MGWRHSGMTLMVDSLSRRTDSHRPIPRAAHGTLPITFVIALLFIGHLGVFAVNSRANEDEASILEGVIEWDSGATVWPSKSSMPSGQELQAEADAFIQESSKHPATSDLEGQLSFTQTNGVSLEQNGAGPTLHLTKSLMLAQLQSTVYCRRKQVAFWNCIRCQSPLVADFEILKVIYDDVWDLTAMIGYWPRFKSIFVVFKGTDSHHLGNWIHDLDILRTLYYPLKYPGYVNARVHLGFFQSLNSSSIGGNVTSELTKALTLHPKSPVYFLGHSLGAAMASIAAPYAKLLHSIDEVNLWTFGSPRTGNLAFVNLLQDQMNESIRFTHDHDIVPSVPNQYFGYHHVPNEIWQVPNATLATGTEFFVCDGTGEDPNCHDSICNSWVHCRYSIADHLMYLGKHMYHNTAEC